MTSRRWRLLLVGIAIVAVVLLTGLEVAVRLAAGRTTAWTRLGTEDVHAVRFHGPGTDILLFGHHGGVMRSVDGGRDWTRLGFDGDALGVDAAPDGSLVVTGHGVLVASSDDGGSWQSLDADLPSLDIHPFGRSRLDPLRMWAYVAGGGVHGSTDSGRTCTKVNDGDLVQLAATGQGETDVLFGVDPDPFRGLIRSIDGARTWESVAAPPMSPVTTLAASADGATLVIGGPGGPYRPNDRGMTCGSVLDVGTVLAAAVGDEGATITAVTDETRLYRSDDGDVTWPAPIGASVTPAPTPLRGSDSRGGTTASMVGEPVGAALAVIVVGTVVALSTAGLLLVSARLRRQG